MFYNKGYNLTGINEIIAEASIAKATLYSHFKSKEDICIAYLQYKNNAFLQAITNFCNTKKEGVDRVTAIFDFLLEFYNTNEFNGCWCVRTISEIPRDNKKIKAEIQLQKTSFISFIENLLKVNTNASDTETLAKHYYLLYEAAVSESHLHTEAWPINLAKEMSYKLIT